MAFSSRSQSELANLDLLRSVAVTFVIVCHLAAFLNRSGDWAHALGHLGVVFFFVHTCLVLLMSLDRQGPGTPGEAALRFYTRRVFRIYPLYAVCIVAVLGLRVPHTPLVPYEPFRGTDVFLNFALLQNLFGKGSVLTPLWSLPYEMQMYLVLPPLYYLLRRAAWRAPVALGLFLAALCTGYLLSGRLLWAWYYVPSFLCGAIAFCLLRRFQPVLSTWWWPVLLAAIAAVYCIGRRPGFHTEALRFDALAALTLGLAIPFFRQNRQRLTSRVAQLIARYSYGIYLSHMIAMWLVFVVMPPFSSLARVALSLLLTAAVSVACYHAIEAPLIRAGKRLADRIVTAPQGAAVQRATAA